MDRSSPVVLGDADIGRSVHQSHPQMRLEAFERARIAVLGSRQVSRRTPEDAPNRLCDRVRRAQWRVR
jgi:hypothetical protein